MFTTAACGGITQSSYLEDKGYGQPSGTKTASVGAPVFQIIKEESLPNIFGKADLFGRKRPVGTTELLYLGVQGERAVFVRRDVDIHSEKTTMNTTPYVYTPQTYTTQSGTIGGWNYYGQQSSVSTPIFIPPNTPQDRIKNVRETPLEAIISPPFNKFFIEGYDIEVVNADQYNLEYRITERSR